MICAKCDKFIAASTEDPVVAGKTGYLHYACFREISALSSRAREDKREASRARRSAAMRAAWDKKRDKKHGKQQDEQSEEVTP